MSNAPTETKVKAGTAGAGVGVAAGAAVCWFIDTVVHTPTVEGDLPGAVTTLVMASTAAVVAYVAGWLAKHTPRP